jgi:hypothetical protein
MNRAKRQKVYLITIVYALAVTWMIALGALWIHPDVALADRIAMTALFPLFVAGVAFGAWANEGGFDE